LLYLWNVTVNILTDGTVASLSGSSGCKVIVDGGTVENSGTSNTCYTIQSNGIVEGTYSQVTVSGGSVLSTSYFNTTAGSTVSDNAIYADTSAVNAQVIVRPRRLHQTGENDNGFITNGMNRSVA